MQDDTEIRKNTVRVVINQLLSDEKTESFPILVTSGSNNVKAVVADGNSGSSGHQIHGRLSDDADKVHAYIKFCKLMAGTYFVVAYSNADH